jgi:hypothetical protein
MDTIKVDIHANNKDNDIQTNNHKDNDIREIKTESLCTKFTNFMNMDFVEAIIKYYCQIISIILLLILIITTVACSYNYIDYNQMSFVQNRLGSVDTSRVYTNGRYFLTLDKFFVNFPSTYQHIVYTTPVFTDIGLQFDLEISFYYKLKPNKLGNTYNLYSKNYESRIINIAKTTIKNEAIQYTINDYIRKRHDIELKLGSILQLTLDEMVGVDVPQKYFRLLTINMPNTLITTSLESAIELQNNQIQQYKQEVSVIKADTQKMVSEINAHAIQIIAYANTTANKIILSSEIILSNQINTARAIGIESVFVGLNITDSNIKTEFVRIFAYIDSNNSKIVQTSNNFILKI